jgi:hypothetical protein
MAQMTHLADAPAVRRGLRRAPISQVCQVMRQAGQVMPRVGDGLTQRRVVDLGRTGSSVCRSH